MHHHDQQVARKILLTVGLAFALVGSSPGSIREFQVSPTTAGDQERVQASELADGRIVYVWEEQFDTNSLVWFNILNPALPEFSRAQRVAPTNDHSQCTPVVAGLSNGGFAIAYAVRSSDITENYDVFYQIYGASGKELLKSPAPAHVELDLDQFHPAIVSLDGIGFVVAFSSLRGHDQDVYYRRFANTGTPLDPLETAANQLGDPALSIGDQGSPDLSALPHGGFILVMEDRLSEHVFGIQFDPNGTPRPVSVQAPETYLFQIDPTDATPGQSVWAAKVSSFTQGGFMVAYNRESWQSPGNRSVRARYFAGDGTVEQEFPVGNHSQRWQDPDIQALSDQTAVISWQALTNFGPNSQWSVWTQPIQLDGSPIMDAFPAGESPQFNRRANHLTTWQTDGWIMSWESLSQDTDGWGSYTRLVAPLDGPVGHLAIEALSSGELSSLNIDFYGQPFECYDLQSTLDFSAWMSVLNTNTDHGHFQYQTTASPDDPTRFFRVERVFSP